MTTFPRPFVIHLRHGEQLPGMELPDGRALVVDDLDGRLITGAASADELLRGGYHGARIEWADENGDDQ